MCVKHIHRFTVHKIPIFFLSTDGISAEWRIQNINSQSDSEFTLHLVLQLDYLQWCYKLHRAPNIMYDLWVLAFIDWIWNFYRNGSSAMKHDRRIIGTYIQSVWGSLFENCELIYEWK